MSYKNLEFLGTASTAAQTAVQREAEEGAVARKAGCQCGSPQSETLDRQAIGREHSVLQLQRALGNRATRHVLRAAQQEEASTPAASVEQEIQGARGGGQGLDGGVKRQMESAFGTNFGGVRVHTDARADSLNRSLNARAFTTGQDVFFRAGAYNPGSSNGRELIAHELTHVVQQGGADVRTSPILSETAQRQPEAKDPDEDKRKLSGPLGAPGLARQQDPDEPAAT